MHRVALPVLILNVTLILPAWSEPLSIAPPGNVAPQFRQAVYPSRVAVARPELGGGFLQFVFGGVRPLSADNPQAGPEADVSNSAPGGAEPAEAGREIEPRYLKQRVAYAGAEKPGTVVIDTRARFLYLVEEGGSALRYGVGVGRPGFGWSGIKAVSMKRAWPDWRPPDEMLKRRPDLPGFMAGGPENPLGARALYLGSSLYRIHGSNEPWTIGTEVSSGCIRMRNEDVIDLYERVRVGTKVVVI
jgi:lipoprotein-anchoring transpeptidase ErfK/SrfK